MTEPTYQPAYEQFYARLPQLYRDTDAQNGWPLKRWMSGIGQQYADVVTLLDRFMYVPPNDRALRHIPLPPSGQKFDSNTDNVDVSLNTPSVWTVDSGWSAAPDGSGVVTNAKYYTLNSFTDGAEVTWSPYLPAGTYTLVVNYAMQSDNGLATVSINGQDMQTITEATGSWTTGSPVAQANVNRSNVLRFTIDRGYTNISVRFDDGAQADNTKRISVGPMYLSNIVGGYQYSTCDLVSPYSADATWLPWLALIFGVQLDTSKSVQDQRDQIFNSYNGFLAGTKNAMATAIKPYLMRTKTVVVFDHSTAPGSIGTGTQWDVLVVTRASETPAGFDPIATIIAAGAKPAGVQLHAATYEASWSTIEADRPYWQGSGTNSWEPNSWEIIEETGLL